jgi:hypothetical protein
MTSEIELMVDRKVLIEALQCSNHNRIVLQRDYNVGKDNFTEVLDVDGCGVTGGKVKLKISRVNHNKTE